MRARPTGYRLLLATVGAERIAELLVSRRHVAWALRHGGVQVGRRHYRWMVALHAGLLAGCAVEVPLASRRFRPALGWPMLAAVVAAQGLRWWCVRSLGRRWSTRVVVIPGEPLVAAGPYRMLRHPNYLAVVVEGAALPLVHSAWITAAAFTAANAAALRVRILAEDAALGLPASSWLRPASRRATS